MASNVLTITLNIRWWVRPYVGLLAMFSHLFRWTPDTQKVAAFIVRYGCKVRKS